LPIAVTISLLTYLVLAIGRLQGFRVDRAGAAIIGATLMIASKSLTIQQAYIIRPSITAPSSFYSA
jgi:hypothetical protein